MATDPNHRANVGAHKSTLNCISAFAPHTSSIRCRSLGKFRRFNIKHSLISPHSPHNITKFRQLEEFFFFFARLKYFVIGIDVVSWRHRESKHGVVVVTKQLAPRTRCYNRASIQRCDAHSALLWRRRHTRGKCKQAIVRKWIPYGE